MCHFCFHFKNNNIIKQLLLPSYSLCVETFMSVQCGLDTTHTCKCQTINSKQLLSQDSDRFAGLNRGFVFQVNGHSFMLQCMVCRYLWIGTSFVLCWMASSTVKLSWTYNQFSKHESSCWQQYTVFHRTKQHREEVREY